MKDRQIMRLVFGIGDWILKLASLISEAVSRKKNHRQKESSADEEQKGDRFIDG